VCGLIGFAPSRPGGQPLELVLARPAGLHVDFDLGFADRPEALLDEALEFFRVGARLGEHGLTP
jgi:hypothetical protein